MGREARRKAAERQIKKVEAWKAGVPTLVQLTQDAYKALQTAMENSVKVEGVIVQLRRAAEQQRRDAMIAAGLIPGHTYRMNADRLTAELV
jgi:hypothetical protein